MSANPSLTFLLVGDFGDLFSTFEKPTKKGYSMYPFARVVSKKNTKSGLGILPKRTFSFKISGPRIQLVLLWRHSLSLQNQMQFYYVLNLKKNSRNGLSK